MAFGEKANSQLGIKGQMDETGKPPTGRCTSSNYADNFRAVIDAAKQNHDNPKGAIFTHANPDPDALGSMMALAWLLERAFGIEVDCFYYGEISHPQNKAMCNLLEPQLRKVEGEYNPAEYQIHILVDTIPANAGVAGHKVDFDMCIDHHKDLPNGGYNGLVIHMKTGSCCSIIFKLIECFCKDHWFEDESDNDSKVATALIVGIMTDTDNMGSDDSTDLEFDAYKKLFPYRNSNFLKQILNFKWSKFWIDKMAEAVQNAFINDEGYAIVGLGLIPEKDRDLISEIASNMVSWASVETAVAFAVVGGDRLEGSVRSQNTTLQVSEFCKKLGGRHGIGGGKQGKGAYRYSLAGVSIDPDEDENLKRKTWEVLRDKEHDRITRTIKK